MTTSRAVDLADFEGLYPPIAADTGDSAPSYLLLGKHGSQVRVSASAHQLLSLAAELPSAECIAVELSARAARAITADEVERKLDDLFQALGDAEARAARGQLPRGFWLRLRLIPAAAVGRLCRGLTWAFRPGAAALLLAAIAAAAAFLLHRDGSLTNYGASFWPAYALFFASLLVHELGHAAACLRYGARPSEIGFTVYLIFPALYSDVSTAWRLRRWQRAVVDLAGAYFQLAVGACYILAFLGGAGEAFRTAFLMILYTNLFSLNPVFKFDGYWLVADALGVVNLSRQPARLVRRLTDLLRRCSGRPLPWPGWIVAVLCLYSGVSFGVWTFFLWRLLPWLAAQIASLPAELSSLVYAAARGDTAGALGSAQAFLTSAAMAGLAGTTLVGFLSGTLRRWLHSHDLRTASSRTP